MKKSFVVILFHICSLMILSCAGENNSYEKNEMYILASDYYKEKLSLIKVNEMKITDDRLILDLTEIRRGAKVIQAGFFSQDIVYIIFEGDNYIPTDSTIYLRVYDINNFNWKDIPIFNNEFVISIRIMDFEKHEGYFSGWTRRNILRHLDFDTQLSSAIFEFSEDEEITAINCRFDDRYIAINTYDKKNNIHRYHFIDKQSYEKTVEGIGQIYVNKYSNFTIHENNSKIYMLDDLFHPMKRIEIPIKRKNIFSRAIPVNENSFIICSFSRTPIYLYNFLFGGEHFMEHYNYQFIRMLDNAETFKLSSIPSNKIVFDVIEKKL